MLTGSSLPVFAFLLLRWLEQEGCHGSGSGVPDCFNPARQGNAKKKSCFPSYYSNTGPSIKTTTKGHPPFYCGPPAQCAPMCCLVFQRHHIAIELPIWFLTESQIGTSKVREKRQLSPGRRMLLPGSLS